MTREQRVATTTAIVFGITERTSQPLTPETVGAIAGAVFALVTRIDGADLVGPGVDYIRVALSLTPAPTPE